MIPGPETRIHQCIFKKGYLMYRTILFSLFVLFILLAVVSCSPAPVEPTPTPALPQDAFSRLDNFGDGYISKIKIDDIKNNTPEEIVSELVTQWLQHYKTESTYQDAAINDFSIDGIRLLDNPSNKNYVIVAAVNFSIIPRKIPNDYGSFPSQPIGPNDTWWHIGAPFGVIKLDDYYYLRLLPGWGT
jgi:hypothetical protein